MQKGNIGVTTENIFPIIKKFLYRLSERDGYSHLYWYSMGGNLIKKVTNGKFEVKDFLGYEMCIRDSTCVDRATMGATVIHSGAKIDKWLGLLHSAHPSGMFHCRDNLCFSNSGFHLKDR